MDCNCLGSEYNNIEQLWRLFLEVNYEICNEDDVVNK
jgi:hypothetical protein